MPSLGDSIFIFVLALMLFGPKRLPQLARQLGKLMAEFRRASNEFRMQMEDELRVEEQKEHQAKVAAMPGPPSELAESTPDFDATPAMDTESAPIPAIAESGSLKMMPPSTGLPVENAAWGTTETPASSEPENSILPPSYGASSEEPLADAATQAEAPQAHEPQTHTEGERATHA